MAEFSKIAIAQSELDYYIPCIAKLRNRTHCVAYRLLRSIMSTSPTPSERERKDKEDRAREKEEQEKLPYKWTQTIQDLDITISVPSNLKGKDIVVDMKKSHLKVCVKGQDPFIDVCIQFQSPYLPYTQC